METSQYIQEESKTSQDLLENPSIGLEKLDGKDQACIAMSSYYLLYR